MEVQVELKIRKRKIKQLLYRKITMNKKIKIRRVREIDKRQKNIVQTSIYKINDLFQFLLLLISPF